jgi:hypothetical protein
MFLTAEDFNVLPYRLVNIDKADNGFYPFLDEQEEEILRKILGGSLYEAFVNGLYTDGDISTPIDEDNIEQRWKDLRDGALYSYNNRTSWKWEGMQKLLKPYIFSQWVDAKAIQLAESGAMIAQAENSDVVSPAYMIVKGYNKFSTLVGNYCSLQNTLYGFLYNSEDTYTDSMGEDYTDIQTYLSEQFQSPGKINTFGF